MEFTVFESSTHITYTFKVMEKTGLRMIEWLEYMTSNSSDYEIRFEDAIVGYLSDEDFEEFRQKYKISLRVVEDEEEEYFNEEELEEPFYESSPYEAWD